MKARLMLTTAALVACGSTICWIHGDAGVPPFPAVSFTSQDEVTVLAAEASARILIIAACVALCRLSTFISVRGSRHYGRQQRHTEHTKASLNFSGCRDRDGGGLCGGRRDGPHLPAAAPADSGLHPRLQRLPPAARQAPPALPGQPRVSGQLLGRGHHGRTAGEREPTLTKASDPRVRAPLGM